MSKIWRSDHQPVAVGGTTLPKLVAAGGGALIDGETGAAVPGMILRERIEAVAAGLAAGGFGYTDTLALWAPNQPPWIGVALGAMAAGGRVTGIGVQATDRELATQLSETGASVLITTPALAARALRSGVREVVVLGEAPGGATPIAALLARGDAERPPARSPQPADVALLPWSSGTTGLPKAVMLTHANLVTAVRQLHAHLRLTPGDVVLAAPPFAHVMGFVITAALPLAFGATVVTLPRLDLGALLALVERHRVTVLVVPPPLVAALARVQDRDLSSVELVVSGGAPLDAARQRALAARLPRAAIGQGWGLTETSAPATGPDRDHGTSPARSGGSRPTRSCGSRTRKPGATSARGRTASSACAVRRTRPATSAGSTPPPG